MIAIVNMELCALVEWLVVEQVALWRVVMLVVIEVVFVEVFVKVVEEVVGVFGDVECLVFWVQSDGTVSLVVVWGCSFVGSNWIGVRFLVDGDGVIVMVLRFGELFCVDDYELVIGALGSCVRDEFVIRSGVGCLILVSGCLWGAIGVVCYELGAFLFEIELRLVRFVVLVVIVVVNVDVRVEVEWLVDE